MENIMEEVKETALMKLTPEQARELCLLVEAEARWENMRHAPSAPDVGPAAKKSLRMVQNAYEAFHSRLTTYNTRHTPAHVPELLLNTPHRLALWCRSMRHLCLAVEHDPQIECPVHLLEKAYRRAERISVRLNQSISRLASPDSVRAAITSFEAIIEWCDKQG
jgi:hypothetical protein